MFLLKWFGLILSEWARLDRAAQQLEVVSNRSLDGRILDLDGDILALSRDRSVNLAERGSRNGITGKLGKHLFGKLAQGVLELYASERRMHGWCTHLQCRQLVEGFLRKKNVRQDKNE
jgi:hypothetical protein